MDNRPEFLRQSQLSSLISSSPIQLTKRDAQNFAKRKNIALDPFDKNAVLDYVNDRTQPRLYRLGLRDAWNKGSISLHTIPLPEDLIAKYEGQATGHALTRSDSVEALKIDYKSSLTAEGRPTFTLKTKKGAESQVPVFADMGTAVKMTRSFNSHSSTGPQFILQMGDHTGLYEAPRGNDMVFTPLTEVSAGVYERSGNIESWTEQATLIKHDVPDVGAFKTSLTSTARGGYTPTSAIVFNTAGMMSCDARRSITGYLGCLDELDASREAEPSKLFSSDPEAMPVWEPSIVGGRGIPEAKKTEWQEKMIAADNTSIHQVVQHYSKTAASVDQILTVRREINSSGASIPLNETTFERISVLLGLKDPAPFNPDEFFGRDFIFPDE